MAKIGKRKFRGISLIEAVLALGLGGIALTQGMNGIAKYSENLKVQATASKIQALNRATSRFSKDNFAELVAAAPAEYDIAVLEPYLSHSVGPDAFGNSYRLSTRTYQIDVPDVATGGTRQESALQTLLVGSHDGSSTAPLNEKILLRSDIANTAGANAGFISTGALTCARPTGAPASRARICGVYGSYAIDSNDFSATNFSDAALVSLVVTGDASYEEDNLRRYDMGDPDLNTMRTDLLMAGNTVTDVGEIAFEASATGITSDDGNLTVDADLDLARNTISGVSDLTASRITLSGGNQMVQSTAGNLNLSGGINVVVGAQNKIVFDPGKNGGSATKRLEFVEGTGDARLPTVTGQRGNLQVGASSGVVRAGEAVTATSPSGRTQEVGSATLEARNMLALTTRTSRIRTLFDEQASELEIQGFANGTAVIGQKRAALATAPSGQQFEVSNGRLVVGEIQATNILCEQCSTGDPFENHRWYSANGMGIHRSGVLYRNLTGSPIQVHAWAKQGSSGRFFVQVRKIGGGWVVVHDDTNSGVSGAGPVVPSGHDVYIGGSRAANILMPTNSRIRFSGGTTWELLPPA